MDEHWHVCDWTSEEMKTILSSFKKNCTFEDFNTQNGKTSGQPEAHRHHASYMNYVVRLRLQTAPPLGFIVKMATPLMQCSHNPLPAAVERGAIEYKAYKFFEKLVRGCVPSPVFYDGQTRCLCTRELIDHRPLVNVVLQGGFSQLGAQSLGACLANIHSSTHILNIGDEGLWDLEQQFPTFQSMIDIIRLFHYERPFDPSDPGKACDPAVTSLLTCVYQDSTVLEAVQQVKRSFIKDKECLIHGDLHIDSVVSQGDDFKEVFSSSGEQTGKCELPGSVQQRSLNSHAFSSVHLAHCVLNMCEAVLGEYLSIMTKNLKQDTRFSEKLLQDILAFTGIEMLGNIIGPPHFAFMDGHAQAQVAAVTSAMTLLKRRHCLKSAAAVVELLQPSDAWTLNGC
ncbi:uncharacterized protein LOC112562875 isoform X2 [Pomacea canaliculata]|uniref:uncharacterized protein LOC112562875 isoform X2 n=1 Tax=Pomacea canaliculata TaxID=400727 RepID=UPI000D73698E|nr:uncharacterized protein LOC112562875 isoform X2 [Pomacea canaliculata]